MDQIASKPLKIKKVGGSYDIRTTAALARALNLRDGDYAVISKLRIIRAEDFEMLGQEIEMAESA
jgi:hypothetical protein